MHVHDLFGLPMFIEILPGVAINAYSRCVLKDGKPRIRLTQQTRNAHPSSLIAAVMMLPKPRRERHETHGTNLLRWEQFVVQTVRIDVAMSARHAQRDFTSAGRELNNISVRSGWIAS